MNPTISTVALDGLDGELVSVTATPDAQDQSETLPLYWVPPLTVVGLPDGAVQESRERVCAAVKNSGCVFPMRRVTVNLAPADLKKEGALFTMECPRHNQDSSVGSRTLSGQTGPMRPLNFQVANCTGTVQWL